jgi:quercetin 2,3-dioxygenase
MTRKIKKTSRSKHTSDGAGVALNRVFGNAEVPEFDPFLLLDAFGSNDRSQYMSGFPWHPHRGIETITYILLGTVEHGDSMGNSGTISTGDVQWMTAGSGIIHQEMPRDNGEEGMHGFQLWANLPASHKMMYPRYQDIKSADIPLLTLANGVKVKVISGEVEGTKGPVKDIITDPEYLDISMPANTSFVHPTKKGHTVFAFIFEGVAYFESDSELLYPSGTVVLYEDGDEIEIRTDDAPARLLLISGKPIGERVAWYGPIVMNTEEELELAFREYRNGLFIKTHN